MVDSAPVAPPPPRQEEEEEARFPTPPTSGKRLRMIDPPPRGDGPARLGLILGLGFYIVITTVFFMGLLAGREDKGASLAQLVGLGEQTNAIITSLMFGGFALTLYAVLTVLQDIARLKAEEDDIDWLLRHERAGVMLVLAPEHEREARLRRGELTVRPEEAVRVETLIDDRVRRVHMARMEGGSAHIAVEELRGIAETRTLRYGQVARFASSLLLLLAVLGTFAGVKTALPALIDAIAVADQGGSGSVQSSIIGPLNAVADAFGGNALALVGAIAVGLMAQGLAVGRRNLLERLELVSAEYIYDNRRTQSADPLIAATETLAEAARGVQEASSSFMGVEGSLAGLSDSFQSAFGGLQDQLSSIMTQQDEMLHQRTSRALEELESRVNALAGVMDHNARLYASLVDRVGERAAESREAVRQMQDASVALTKGLDGILRLGDASSRATERLEKGMSALVEGTGKVEARMDAVAEAVEHARPALQEVETALRAATERVASIDERAARAWAGAASEVQQQVAALARAVGEVQERARSLSAAPAALPASSGGGGLSPDAVALLRRIATAAETPRGPTPLALAGSAMAGVLGATAVLYLLGNLDGILRALGIGE